MIVLLRVVTNDESLASEALDECLKPLRTIYVGKRVYLAKYIEQIVAALSRHAERGKEAFTEFNKEKEIITVATVHDCAPNAFLVRLDYKAMLLRILNSKISGENGIEDGVHIRQEIH